MYYNDLIFLLVSYMEKYINCIYDLKIHTCHTKKEILNTLPNIFYFIITNNRINE